MDLEGRGYTLRDGDLRVWMSVDELPVVCKQGVRGSSPLSSTSRFQYLARSDAVNSGSPRIARVGRLALPGWLGGIWEIIFSLSPGVA